MLYKLNAYLLFLPLLTLTGVLLQANTELYTRFKSRYERPRGLFEKFVRKPMSDESDSFTKASILFKELEDGSWYFIIDGVIKTKTSTGCTKNKPFFCGMTITPFCANSFISSQFVLFNTFLTKKLHELYAPTKESDFRVEKEALDELKAVVERMKQKGTIKTIQQLEEFPARLRAILEEYIYLLSLTNIVEFKTDRKAFTVQLLELHDGFKSARANH